MLMMPSIFGENLFDDWMMDDFPMLHIDKDVNKKLYGKHAGQLMKTDVKELEHGYEVDIDLPGFKKENVQVKLDKGYLTVNASKGLEEKETDKESGRYIRRERYGGSMSRSYYVGENVKQTDIHAKFEDGILRLEIPKVDQPKIEEQKLITIE